MTRWSPSLLLGLVLVAPGDAFAADHMPAVSDNLRTLQHLDQRVADIGYRLSRTAVPFCAERAKLSGITLHGLEEYGPPSRDVARRTFGLDDALAVLAVTHGSPAETAGLRVGDAILAVNEQDLPAPDSRRGPTARVEAALRAVEQSTKVGLTFDLRRNGERLRITFVPEQGCITLFWVIPSSHLAAEADGHDVEITSAYVDRAGDDAALAIVLAHELAHNILHHRQRLDRDGAHRGLARYFGRSARLNRAAELEADRLSVAIVGCAGYSLTDALAFRAALWRDSLGDALLRAPDHPAARQRLEAIRESIAAFGANPMPCRDQTPAQIN